ncbi:MAG: C-terminal binding protein [Nitriliruptoraceae bacterium]|jgi:D-3-phosphoglycerate dehydrogenase
MTRHVVAVLGTRYPDLSIEESILGPLDVELVAGDGGDPDAIAAVAGAADVLLLGSRPRITDEVLGRLRCRGLVRYGIGVDAIDLSAARRRGVWVANVTTYGTEAVSVHALALAMAGFRRIVASDRWVKDGNWGFEHLRPLHLPSASTAGVVGYGRIGRYTAGLLAAVGFRVLVHDPYVTAAEPGHELVTDLGDLIARSDVVSLHVPGNPDGSPLIGADLLARSRPGSVLVNTARGSLIDTEALVAALATGAPAVAALDVFPREPVDPALFAAVAERVIMTPHTSWYSEESERDMRVKASEAAAALLRGERPAEVVVDPDAPVGA